MSAATYSRLTSCPSFGAWLAASQMYSSNALCMTTTVQTQDNKLWVLYWHPLLVYVNIMAQPE